MEKIGIKKYFTCIIIAILIISISVSLGTYKLKLQNMPSQAKSDAETIQDLEGMIDDNNDETTEEKVVKKYTKATAFECVQDSINQLLSSKGYRAIFSTSCKVYVADILFATQTATEEFITSGKYHLKKTIANCDSSYGQTYYRYFYSEDNLQTIEYRRTRSFSNNIPDWSGTDINVTTTKDQIQAQHDRFPGVLFTILPTKKTAITSFDKFSNDKYYIIKFALTPNEVTDAYKENIIWQGDLVGVDIKSMSFSFYIEKSTLNLRKVERRETYDAQKTSNLSGFTDLTTSITFPTINKEIIPSRPLDQF